MNRYRTNREFRERIKKMVCEFRKKEYHKRKESGLCVYCGKCPPENGRVSCNKCLSKFRKQIKK